MKEEDANIQIQQGVCWFMYAFCLPDVAVSCVKLKKLHQSLLFAGFACLHTKTPQGHFGAPLFHLVHCYIYLCIAPLLVLYHTLYCEPGPVSHTSLAVGLIV